MRVILFSVPILSPEIQASQDILCKLNSKISDRYLLKTLSVEIMLLSMHLGVIIGVINVNDGNLVCNSYTDPKFAKKIEKVLYCLDTWTQ